MSGGQGLTFIESEYQYYIIEIRAHNSIPSSAHILKNWNNSGINLNATPNDVHLNFLVKITVPMDDAIERVTKTLEEGLAKTRSQSPSPADQISYNYGNQLAHENPINSIPLLNPNVPSCTAQCDLFPDVLLVNEVNNDPYLTYVIFKAFHENYMIGNYTKEQQLPKKMHEVKLSYFFPKEIENTLNSVKPNQRLEIDEKLMDNLIFMVNSCNSSVQKTLQNLTTPKYFGKFLRRLAIDVTLDVKNKRYTHVSRNNELILVKKPDVLVFPCAFLEELPSYNTATALELSSRLKLDRYQNKIKHIFKK